MNSRKPYKTYTKEFKYPEFKHIFIKPSPSGEKCGLGYRLHPYYRCFPRVLFRREDDIVGSIFLQA